MTMFEVKVPDVGEGVAEAELVAWFAETGDQVTTDSVLAEVMTDKATVEISSPVAGTVTELHGDPGDVLAVGGHLVTIDLAADAPAPAPAPADTGTERDGDPPAPTGTAEPVPVEAPPAESEPATVRPKRSLASPAVRSRARSLGLDLASVSGSGPDGRVVHADLDRQLVASNGSLIPTIGGSGSDSVRQEPVRGLRRRIAERLASAWAEIPHITYVEAVDATELEALRAKLNQRGDGDRPRLTLLPFIARAIVLACAEQPRLNAHYDSTAQSLAISSAVHIGVATQTDNGLMVPVVRNIESLDLAGLARGIADAADRARSGKASRAELSGSTITITSLGALGGLVTTPIINQPEVAVVGVNKLETRPVWRDGAFQPRRMLNLSSSFDHRIVDGWDAAVFVQRLRELLEAPALLFVADAH